MTWHSTWAFLLLLPLVGLTYWMWWLRKSRRGSIRFSTLANLNQVHRGLRAQLVQLPAVLKILGLVLVIVALARPQKPDTKIKRNVEGIDIVIVFDISDSMLIEDMKPENRLEAAKLVVSNFIRGRVSDRIGLVAFAGESYTRVPLTLDYPLLLQNVADLQPARNIKMGTAIGVALANGVARIKDSTAKSQVIILMTDGESNSGTIDPETALDIAKGYKIKIYSIGMGRDGDAQLPVVIEDVFGRKVKRYRPIHSKVNESLLSQMAKETGGRFWRATTGGALEGVFKEINRLERSDIEVSKFTQYAELFETYLWWGTWVYLSAIFLVLTVFRRGM